MKPMKAMKPQPPGQSPGQRRCVHQDRGRTSVPYKATLWVNGKPTSLGRYASREEAQAACRAVRRFFPTKATTKPPLSEQTRAAILKTYERLNSGRATARVHGVAPETVQRLVRTRRGSTAMLEDYPDMMISEAPPDYPAAVKENCCRERSVR